MCCEHVATGVAIRTEGVSTSRTCEIGLSGHSGVVIISLYLVDQVTQQPGEPERSDLQVADF
jgi:hypothetical protein